MKTNQWIKVLSRVNVLNNHDVKCSWKIVSCLLLASFSGVVFSQQSCANTFQDYQSNTPLNSQTNSPINPQMISDLTIQDPLRIMSLNDYNLGSNNEIIYHKWIGNKPGYKYHLQLLPQYLATNKIKKMKININCDQEVIFHSKGMVDSQIKGQFINTVLFDRKDLLDKDDKFIEIPENVKSCDMTWENTDLYNKKIYAGLRLQQEYSAFNFLPPIIQLKQLCDYSGTSLPAENIFFSNKYKDITCAYNSEQVETLSSPESGFRAKIETLLGQKISDEFINNANASAPMDFSKTPHLKAIFVASLVYRSDFYGSIMNRLLQHHADKGTPVYIITTSYMQSDIDHERLRNLSKEHPNIRLQEYEYHGVKNGFGKIPEKVNELHRDMHIKMFVVLSDENPNDNIIVTGGRNIHDGFLFKTKPDYSVSDLTKHYVPERHVHWSDFEIKLVSPELAQVLFAHLMTFWNRDTLTQKVKYINQADAENKIFQDIDKKSLDFSKPLFRHVISAPFNDHHQLEQIYVDMIDKAKFQIKFSSPYLRPTDKITAALKRAIQRGVKITIQTRINLEGDTLPWLYSEMNKASINNFYQSAKIYEWMEPSILHSKFILIDQTFGFVGSVNISQRSFIHDMESGFVVYGPSFIKSLESIFDGYTSKSKLITKKQKLNIPVQVLLKLLKDKF